MNLVRLYKFIPSAMKDFKIGDLVRIRKIDDMTMQFGCSPNSTIGAYGSFVYAMYKLEGKTFVISNISQNFVYGHRFGFNISTDMIEHVR
jgi:hypothetical protein